MRIIAFLLISFFTVSSISSVYAQEGEYTPTSEDQRIANSFEQLLDNSSDVQIMSTLTYLSKLNLAKNVSPKLKWYITDLVEVAQNIAIDRLIQLTIQKPGFDNYSLIYGAYDFGDYSSLRLPVVSIGNTVQTEYRIKNDAGVVLYTNQERIAKQNNLYDPARTYSPLEYLILGDGISKGFYKRILGKKVGETAVFTILPGETFQIRRGSMIATDILTVEIDILTIK